MIAAVVCTLSIDELLNISSYFEKREDEIFYIGLLFTIGIIWTILGMLLQLFVEEKFITNEDNPSLYKFVGYLIPKKMRKYIIFPVSYICVSIYLIYYGMFNLLERIGEVLFWLVCFSLMGTFINWIQNQFD